MNSSRSFNWPLSLLVLLGWVCDGNYVSAQPGRDSPKACVVTISKCTVSVDSSCPEDPVDSKSPQVNIGDSVTWIVQDGMPYSIKFPHHYTPFQTDHPQVSTSQQVIGNDACNYSGLNYFCKFNYALTRSDTNEVCRDPGVRVVPPGTNLYLLIELLGAIIVATYLAFRIRSRNRASPTK